VYRGGWLVEFSGVNETGRTVFNATATADKLRQDNLILATGVVYPRKLHHELGVFDQGMSDYWDWDWYLRVTGAGYRLHKLRGLGVAIAQHGANMSYGSRSLERQNNLDRLSAKHGLVGIVLKDHSIIAKEEPQENLEPPLSV
jgi:GT2 family glycosyltransferase